MNPETKLYRQVHPSWIQGDYVTSLAFAPSKKDHGHLSVDHGDMVTAQQSYDHYTQKLGLGSAGTMSILYIECTENSLQAYNDGVPYPSHCYIDFAKVPSASRARALGKILQLKSLSRGWEYRPAPAASA